MTRAKTHLITGVEPDSIAAGLGLAAGDVLLRIGDRAIQDVFDYRTALAEQRIELYIAHKRGETVVYEIDKDEDEDIGLIFGTDLMDDCRSCSNRCAFCFIDQLPRGMRPSLYFKDDDLRMSFLNGNYVTLTNLDDVEFDRLLGFRLSPMNISVHALAPDVRVALLNNRLAGRLLERMRRIAAQHISMNAQIVLVPGANDGAVLEDTLSGLASLGEQLQSVSVVPVGLTRYREANRLPALRAFDRDGARAVVEQIHAWQQRMLTWRACHWVYPADEFYLKAGLALPAAAVYEDFPQLENGVGMVPLFDQEMKQGLTLRARRARSGGGKPSPSVHAVSGVDFAPLLDRYSPAIRDLYPIDWHVHAIRNVFFGDQITVAGLLTAADLAAGMSPRIGFRGDEIVLVPDTMLRADGEIFLDDWTPARLGRELGAVVEVCTATADGLLAWLDQFVTREVVWDG